MELMHELLFALNGNPGDIFSLNDKNEIRVTNVVSFCLPSEQDALNRVCQLGTAYYKIKECLRIVGTTSSNPVAGNASPLLFRGLYITAFCNGFNDVLKSYRDALIKLEEDVLKDSYLTLSYIQASLAEFDILFPYLIRLLNDVIAKEVHGCQILGVIYDHCESGIALVSRAVRLLHQTCSAVMINHLHSFLIYGVIQDPYGEFFVQKSESVDLKNQSPAEGGAIAKKQDNPIKPKSTFIVRQEMVPPYISWKTAETILFIGETIHMFNTNKVQFGNIISMMQVEKETFSKQLFQLIKVDEPSFSDLEKVIDNVRACVAEHLWKLVVENCDLIKHLQTLKDLYLLGCGELFLRFLDQTHHLMNQAPSTSIEHDIKVEFQMAARSIALEDDNCFKKFRLIVNKSKKSRAKSSANTTTFSNGNATVWDYITMEYTPPGILQLMFTPDALEKYNTIFRFLLHVKRVQLELHRCWATQMSGKHDQNFKSYIRHWHLRSCMAFVVDNLQYYLQVDVLESQFCILLEKVKTTRDFEQIQLDHVSFLNNILMRTFISIKTVFQCLQNFMQFCLSYCEAVKQSPHLQPAQLQHFEEEFYHGYTGLITVLGFIRGHEVSPHLSQFMLRIHFNDYLQNFAKSKKPPG